MNLERVLIDTMIDRVLNQAEDPSTSIEKREAALIFVSAWQEWNVLRDREIKMLRRNVFIFLLTMPVFFFLSRRASKKFEELYTAQTEWINAA